MEKRSDPLGIALAPLASASLQQRVPPPDEHRRPTTADLLAIIGLSATVLAQSYKRRPELVRRIADALAQLYTASPVLPVAPEQAARLLDFINGSPDPELRDALEFRGRIGRCLGPGPHVDSVRPDLPPTWYDPAVDSERYQPKSGRCSRCVRAVYQPEEGTRGLDWEAQIAELLPTAPLPLPQAKADRLRAAFYRVRAAGRAVAVKRWAESAGLDQRELLEALQGAGLPLKPRANRKGPPSALRLLPLVYALRALSPDTAAALVGPGPSATGSTNQVVRRVELLRLFLALLLNELEKAERSGGLIDLASYARRRSTSASYARSKSTRRPGAALRVTVTSRVARRAA
jgi:hypothetical protein